MLQDIYSINYQLWTVLESCHFLKLLMSMIFCKTQHLHNHCTIVFHPKIITYLLSHSFLSFAISQL